jgi:hypothetical protein
MEFWSKGLGTKTLVLDLSRGRTQRNQDVLYLDGRMEPPVEWDYIMPMRGQDILDFFDLLADPGLARYVHRSPNRRHLYAALVGHGLGLAGLVLLHIARRVLGLVPARENVQIEVPPASVLKKRRKKKSDEDVAKARRPYRRRLSREAPSAAPSLTAAMREQEPLLEDAEEVEEAIQEAMEAASHIGE